MERCEIVYRMSSDFGIDGIDVHEVADVMYAFAETVDAALKESGEDGVLKVNVRPFKQGSFITEFVLEYSQQAVSLFSGDPANALANILGILGFCGGGALTIPKVVKKVRGRIDRCRDNGDGSFTYGDGADSILVDEKTHRIIQSPKVAKPYKTVTIGPIVKIDRSMNISIQGRGDLDRGDGFLGSRFDAADVDDIESYAKVAVEGIPEDQEEIVSDSHNVVLIPQAGPYDGGENGYTFKRGDHTIRKVQMHDLGFRLKLESGEVRLMNRDLLIVDMQDIQTVSKRGRVSTSFRITKVIRYEPYSPPAQMTIDDFV